MYLDESDKEQIDFIHKFDYESRGKFLIQVSFIDDILNGVIGNHFCDTEQKRNEIPLSS